MVELATGRGSGTRAGRATRREQPNTIDKGQTRQRIRDFDQSVQAHGQATAQAHGQLAAAFGSFFGLGQQIMADAGREKAVKDTAAINAEADRMRAEILKDPEKAKAAYDSKDWSTYDTGSEHFSNPHVVTTRRKVSAQQSSLRLYPDLQARLDAAGPGDDLFTIQDAFIEEHAKGAEGEWAAEFASTTSQKSTKAIGEIQQQRQALVRSDAIESGVLAFEEKADAGQIVRTGPGLQQARDTLAQSIPNASGPEAMAIARDRIDQSILRGAAEGKEWAIQLGTVRESQFDNRNLMERREDDYINAVNQGRKRQEAMKTAAGWDAHDAMTERLALFEATGEGDLDEMLIDSLGNLQEHGTEQTNLLAQRAKIIRLRDGAGDLVGLAKHQLAGNPNKETKSTWNKLVEIYRNPDQVRQLAKQEGQDPELAVARSIELIAVNGLGDKKTSFSNAFRSSTNGEQVFADYQWLKLVNSASHQSLEDGDVLDGPAADMFYQMLVLERAGKNPMDARAQWQKIEEKDLTVSGHFGRRMDKHGKIEKPQQARQKVIDFWNKRFSSEAHTRVNSPFLAGWGFEGFDNDVDFDELGSDIQGAVFEAYDRASVMAIGQEDEVAATDLIAMEILKGQFSINGIKADGNGILGFNNNPAGGPVKTLEYYQRALSDMEHDDNALFNGIIEGDVSFEADRLSKTPIGGVQAMVRTPGSLRKELSFTPGERFWVKGSSLGDFVGHIRDPRDTQGAENHMIQVKASDGENVLIQFRDVPGPTDPMADVSSNLRGIYDGERMKWFVRYYPVDDDRLTLEDIAGSEVEPDDVAARNAAAAQAGDLVSP